MKKSFFFTFLVSFLIGFFILYLERNRLTYFSVLLPHIKMSEHKASNNSQEASKIIYGVNVDMNQLLPSSLGYVKNSKGEDLIDIAHRLGVNLFRITNASGVTATGKEKIYTKRQWDQVLNKMDKNGIKALIVIESDSTDPNMYSKEIQPVYLKLVDDYVVKSGLLDNPDVYAVDLKNEPIISKNNLSFIKKAKDLIKAKYPQTKLTVGWWAVDLNKKDSSGEEMYAYDDYSAGTVFEDIVDFYSIHTYGYDKKILEVYPDPYNLTLYALNKALPIFKKPILIEEFGAGNGDALTDQITLGSEKLQANAYDGVYQAVIDTAPQNVLGSVAYQFIKRNAKMDGFAILKNNGNYIYPAAYVLQKYALGKSDIKLDMPLRNTPNDILLTNEDNGKTINIKVADVLGLHLKLSNDFTNTVSVSNSSLLLKTEPLVREDNKQFVDGVFHASKIGKSTVKVIGRKNGEVVTRFSVTINVEN